MPPFDPLHCVGSAQFQRSRRPRPSSDGLSLAASVNMESVWQHPPARLSSSRSYDSLLPREQCHGNQGEAVGLTMNLYALYLCTTCVLQVYTAVD